MTIVQNIIILVIDWFHKPFRKYIPEETFRYAATGGFNTFLDIFLYYIIYNFVLYKQILDLGFYAFKPHIAAFIIGFPITFITGFALAKYITFTDSPFRGKKQLVRYGVSVLGSILLNYLLLKLFVEVFDFYATPSKMITTVFVVAYSYMIQRYYTFKTASIRKS